MQYTIFGTILDTFLTRNKTKEKSKRPYCVLSMSIYFVINIRVDTSPTLPILINHDGNEPNRHPPTHTHIIK